jgi:PH domain
MADTKSSQLDHYKGWLFKWTNYLKGYQKRWFVLQNGFLSYYRFLSHFVSVCVILHVYLYFFVFCTCVDTLNTRRSFVVTIAKALSLIYLFHKRSYFVV